MNSMEQQDLHCPDGRGGPSLFSFTPSYFADYSQTAVRTLELHGKVTLLQMFYFFQYLLQAKKDCYRHSRKDDGEAELHGGEKQQAYYTVQYQSLIAAMQHGTCNAWAYFHMSSANRQQEMQEESMSVGREQRRISLQ